MDAVETPFTNYVYDTMNRIKEVYDSGQEVASYKYYPDHMPKSVSFANGVEVNYGYDLDKNRTQATTISPSGKVLLEHSYGYDGNGNQLWKQEAQAKTSYTYDSVNRLAAVNYPKRGKECFTYDLAGNRTTRQLEDTIETYTYNAKNQLMAWHTNQESTTYEYDKQGNLLFEQGLGKETTYEYDGFNRTVGAHLPSGDTLVHRYDPEGLRAEVEENGKLRKFLFSGRNIIAELDQEDQVTARFIRGSELLAQDDAQDQRYYYHLNEHGDVTHLLDGKANVVNCYEYDAFGNTVESKEEVYNPFHYAGEQYDTAIGQYYLRARFYNPVIARFTQEDVYRGDGLNLYAYVSNNPVKYVDPSGYKECKADAVQGTGTPVEGAGNPEDFVEVTLRYKESMPINEFNRKANVLKELGDQGLLYKAHNPVVRDPNLTKAYKSQIIKKVWNQYSKNNPEFANKLIDRIKCRMQPDHVWELQLGGPDIKSNLKLLDSFTNWDIGVTQIRQQIRNLEDYTKIRINIEK